MKTKYILIPAAALFLASGAALAWPGDKADTDGDGVISKEEFMQKHMKRGEKMFGKLDADGDGQISAEERKAAREKFKEHRKKHKGDHHDRGDKMEESAGEE